MPGDMVYSLDLVDIDVGKSSLDETASEPTTGDLDSVDPVSVESGLDLDVLGVDSEYTVVDQYYGDYRITPTLGGVDLDTDGKLLTEDLNVLPIPVSAVSNDAGGRTYTIA